jgi:hypothetical protein
MNASTFRLKICIAPNIVHFVFRVLVRSSSLLRIVRKVEILICVEYIFTFDSYNRLLICINMHLYQVLSCFVLDSVVIYIYIYIISVCYSILLLFIWICYVF